jgi:ABC-2 type transport system permease protein
MSVEAKGVIHDIGYQRYDGPRLGRGYARQSLYVHGLRTAFGLGRTGKAMIFPWTVVGLMLLVAVVLVAVRTQIGEMPLSYRMFPVALVTLPILFCAVVAPELVSRDLRGGVLPLYFSRPLTRTDYALAKLAALITALFLMLAGPQLFIYLGGVFTLDGGAAIWNETIDFGQGLVQSVVFALLLGAMALLVASLAGRRAVAAAMIVAVFFITTPVYGVLMGLAYSRADYDDMGAHLSGGALTLSQVAGLVSPMTLADGVGQWLFEPDPGVGSYGPLYGLVVLGLIVISVLLLVVRYRKVAR